MRIGQVAAKVSVARSALRFYEAAGLLTPTERTAAGYRIYGPESAHGAADERSVLQTVLARKIEETRAEMAELTS